MKIIALIIALLPAAAFGYECKSPDAFVKSVSADVIAVAKSSSGETEKEKKLENIFIQIVDTDRMSKFALGKNYRTLKPTEQNEFKTIYRNFLLATYIPSFKKYNGQKIEVTGTKTAGAGDIIVATKIVGDSGPETLVDYRLARKAGCFQLNDIIAEGVSLINTQRQDFDSIIGRKGYMELTNMLVERSKNQ